MTLYLDTEFNGHGGDLISMAIVSDQTQEEFYEVLAFHSNPMDPWVRANVIPILNKPAIPYLSFRHKLFTFLTLHTKPDEPIVADWPHDFTLLTKIMQGPSFQTSWTRPLTFKLIETEEIKSTIQHNALEDARALMLWCKANSSRYQT